MPSERPTLRVTEIGEFVHYKSCERRFKLGTNQSDLIEKYPLYDELFNQLDPVLQESGRKRELEWEQSLIAQGFIGIGTQTKSKSGRSFVSWEHFVEALSRLEPGQQAYAGEVAVSGRIGAFDVAGQADFVLVLWKEQTPYLRIVECKASRKDKTYHRVQLCVYRMLISELVSNSTITPKPCRVEGVVARINEVGNQAQPILSLQPLNLDMIESDIKILLSEHGALDQVWRKDLDELEYQLESKCDDCRFNIHCLPESARGRRLELLGCPSSSVRALKAVGIRTLDALAAIDLDGDQARSIAEAHALTEGLEHLKARASARLSTLPVNPKTTDIYSSDSQAGPTAQKRVGFHIAALPRTFQSQLPEHEINGKRLVRIYLIVDYDYTENRVSCLTAHVTNSVGKLAPRWEHDAEVAGDRAPA